MREWIQTGVMVAVAVAVIVFMALVMRQMNTANQAVVEALKSNATAVNPLVTLKVKVTRGTEDGPPAEGVEVRVVGDAFGSSISDTKPNMRRYVDKTGYASFGPMQPGQFEVYAWDTVSGLRADRVQVTLFSGTEPELLHIVAPNVAPRETSIEFAEPVVLGEDRALSVHVRAQWEGKSTLWRGDVSAFVDDAGFQSVDPDITDEETRDWGNDSEWSQLETERYPFQMSGEVKTIYVSLLIQGDNNKSRQVLTAELSTANIDALDDGRGYRLELPAAFNEQFMEWRNEDHLKANGITLDWKLYSKIRGSYPEFLVDGADRVVGSRSGLSVAGTLVSRPLNRPDMSLAFVYNETLEGYTTGSGQALGETMANDVALFKGPPEELLSLAGGGRILLALNVDQLNAEEFDQELQVWPILSPVLENNWLSYEAMEASSLTSGLKLALGPNPLVSIPVPKLAKELDVEDQKSDWLLLDLSENLLAADVNLRGKEFVLRWARMEVEYKSMISVISAEAREMKFENRRPMWIVLKPMAAEEVAAAQ